MNSSHQTTDQAMNQITHGTNKTMDTSEKFVQQLTEPKPSVMPKDQFNQNQQNIEALSQHVLAQLLNANIQMQGPAFQQSNLNKDSLQQIMDTLQQMKSLNFPRSEQNEVTMSNIQTQMSNLNPQAAYSVQSDLNQSTYTVGHNKRQKTTNNLASLQSLEKLKQGSNPAHSHPHSLKNVDQSHGSNRKDGKEQLSLHNSE